jgi:hypothetical protein
MKTTDERLAQSDMQLGQKKSRKGCGPARRRRSVQHVPGEEEKVECAESGSSGLGRELGGPRQQLRAFRARVRRALQWLQCDQKIAKRRRR